MNEDIKSLFKTRPFLVTTGVAAALILAGWIAYFTLLGAPEKQAELEHFATNAHSDNVIITQKLKDDGYIKNPFIFRKLLTLRTGMGSTIEPGAYQISKSMNAWEIAGIFAKGPNMKWIVIPEGFRKEQIADILSQELGWNLGVKNTWVNELTAMKFDEVEGVYFPDTYLIPLDDTPLETANRLRTRFNEAFAPYSKEAFNQNIQWITVLKIASLVQREAAGKQDMPLIAGVIWNRLDQDMKLEIDATVQYVRDTQKAYDKKEANQPFAPYISIPDWWTPIAPSDKQLDSPYNTYMYEGLPPHPIANPGLDAIKAVLSPTETACLFYLHDNSKNIHCAETYSEHEANIDKYLR
jgi:UPF0755 protein